MYLNSIKNKMKIMMITRIMKIMVKNNIKMKKEEEEIRRNSSKFKIKKNKNKTTFNNLLLSNNCNHNSKWNWKMNRMKKRMILKKKL